VQRAWYQAQRISPLVDRAVFVSYSSAQLHWPNQYDLGRVLLRSALARALSAALVISKSGLDRSLTLLPRERSRKNKMATLTKGNFCSGSNFEWHFWSQWHEFYSYTVSEQMSTTKKKEWEKEHIKTNEKPNEITVCLRTNKHTSHVTKAVGIEFFLWSQKISALAGTDRLVRDRSRQ